MPAKFLECVRKRGKIRTRILSDGRYQYICYLDNKAYPSEIHKKKKKKSKK